MIKKCKILTRNTINMVILYDGVEVQLPADHTIDKIIYVKKTDNSFSISSEEEFERSIKKKQKKVSEVELAKVDNIENDNKTTDRNTNIS